MKERQKIPSLARDYNLRSDTSNKPLHSYTFGNKRGVVEAVVKKNWHFKTLSKHLCLLLEYINLFTLNFQFLGHIGEEVSLIGVSTPWTHLAFNISATSTRTLYAWRLRNVMLRWRKKWKLWTWQLEGKQVGKILWRKWVNNGVPGTSRK